MEKVCKIGGGIIRALNRFILTGWIIDIFYNQSGLCDFLNRHRKCKKEYLKTVQEFYKNNRKQVLDNTNLLADDKSKKIYNQIIKYRCYRYTKDIRNIISNDQYFPKDIIKFNDNEVFIDVGSYDGRVAKEFIQKVNGKYKLIVSLEPDKKNYNRVIKRLKNIPNNIIINKGAYSKNTKVTFSNDGTYVSKITNEGNYKIDTIKIDSIKECSDASYIKMDIEGAEMEALKGAEKIIKRNKPKLAICIYHSDEDMINIIPYIHNLVLEYKLYIRHHKFSSSETVLYAIKDN